MISRFHLVLFNKAEENSPKNKKLINFDLAEKEIRAMFKRSLELNVENKRLSITSAKRLTSDELNNTMLNDEELKKPVNMALNSIIDKHGRLDQKKL
jgi:hypothetical protein